MSTVNETVAVKPTRLLRLADVKDRVGLSRTAIYDAIQQGKFPAPRRLLQRGVCWRESDIDDFINGLEVAGAKVAA